MGAVMGCAGVHGWEQGMGLGGWQMVRWTDRQGLCHGTSECMWQEHGTGLGVRQDGQGWGDGPQTAGYETSTWGHRQTDRQTDG